MPTERLDSSFGEAATDVAHRFTISDLEDATKNFEKKVGSGGFGIVYYGKLKDGKKITGKVLTSSSYPETRIFERGNFSRD